MPKFRKLTLQIYEDMYLIIPDSNEASRFIEINNIQSLAQGNNIKLNSAKSCEVFLFADVRW